MVAGRFLLPDVDGVLVKGVFEEMAGRMRPAKGRPWARLEHRMADSLVDLCQTYADATPTRRSRPLVVVHTDGSSAEADGIPLSLDTVDAMRDEARIVDQHDDVVIDHGTERLIGDPDHHDGLKLIKVSARARAGPAP